MKSAIFGNLKTSLGGALGSACLLVVDFMQKGTTDMQTLLLAFVMAYIGAVAKDG